MDATVSLRRHVFLVAGYDPRGVNGYFERMNLSLRSAAKRDGRTLSIGPLETRGPISSFWRVDALSPQGETNTVLEYLHWDDIVRQHWNRMGKIGALVAAVRVLWVYWRSGMLARSKTAARAVRIAIIALGLAPLALGLASLLFSLAVGALGMFGARSLGGPSLAGWAIGFAALVVALIAADRAWRAVKLEWLARGFSCIIETALAERPGWDQRCREFAARLAEVERDDETDEIVVLGHSLGAILAMKALHGFLSARAEAASPRKIAFATLGQIIPFYTLIEPSRATLRAGCEVAANPSIDWIDVTSGSDPGSACRLGPLAGADEIGLAPNVFRWDPEFHRILTPERFGHIRKHALDFHFQYLKSADFPGGFDLMRMLMSSAPFFSSAPR